MRIKPLADRVVIKLVEEEETTVIGVGGKSYTEVKASYEVSDADCAYARILGNISTIDSFMVRRSNG